MHCVVTKNFTLLIAKIALDIFRADYVNMFIPC